MRWSKRSLAVQFFTTMLAVVLLSSCRGIAFSPEAAASSAIMGNFDSNVALIDDSLTVRQTEKVTETHAVVVLTFQQLRNRTDVENCLYSYQVQKRSMGWFMKSGGGGCWPQAVEFQEGQEIQIGSGQSHSSDPGDIGFSTAYGLVRVPDIVKVQITWNDETQSEPDVVDSSFVAYRMGLFNVQKVEGFDTQGDVLYSFVSQIAPGKLP